MHGSERRNGRRSEDAPGPRGLDGEGNPAAMRFLRRALRANAAFSTISGLVMVGGGVSLAAWLGRAGSMMPDGIGLLGFAAVLLWVTRREVVSLAGAGAIVVLDLLWVADTVRQVAGGDLSTAGGWFFGVAALAVSTFALLQAEGIRRAHSARSDSSGSTRVARTAGSQAASSAADASTSVTVK